ncbi:MAG: hypothetical protein K5886_00810 [Lachnospiraceae bacterium]|nr:hypothetical protein [Lachnospiraceae bacterium]
MIDKKDILSFNYYNSLKPFTGSDRGMRYRIIKIKGDEETAPSFKISVWPEPLCYEKTDRSGIIETVLPFTQEGYEEIVPYLNSMHDRVAGPSR